MTTERIDQAVNDIDGLLKRLKDTSINVMIRVITFFILCLIGVAFFSVKAAENPTYWAMVILSALGAFAIAVTSQEPLLSIRSCLKLNKFVIRAREEKELAEKLRKLTDLVNEVHRQLD